MKKTVFLDVIVFLFVSLFVYASVSKLIDYNEFVAQIGKSPLIMRYPKFVGCVVPAVEIVTSLFLLVPRLQILGFYMSFTLMFMFTLYIAFILTFSPYVPCSCGGILESMGWAEHLVFNMIFVALSVIGIWLRNQIQEQEKLERDNGILTPIMK